MSMSESQSHIVFWIYIGFFVVIGIVAILAILGIIKTDKQFRKWAVTGFVVSLTGVVFIWGRSPAPTPPLFDLFVNLEPPAGVVRETFTLDEGNYEYSDDASSDARSPHVGHVELTLEPGGWVAKLPYQVVNKAVKLKFKDKSGKWWEVRSFYPTHNRQLLVQSEAPQKAVAKSLTIPFLEKNAFAAEQTVKIDNYAKPAGTMPNGKPYYKWRIFVDEPNEVLDSMAEVQYLLDPSFPQPLKVQKNRGQKFAIEGSSWGEFWIAITIKFKDKSTVTMPYRLTFSKTWP